MFNEEIAKRLEDIITYKGLSVPPSLQDLEALELALKAVKLMQLEDIDIDGTYWLYYDDNGNPRTNNENSN